MPKPYKLNDGSDCDPSYSPLDDMMSEILYDSDGQPNCGGVGQGAPLDENGRYIYSQIGQPVVASPPLPSPPPAGNVVHRESPH